MSWPRRRATVLLVLVTALVGSGAVGLATGALPGLDGLAAISSGAAGAIFLYAEYQAHRTAQAARTPTIADRIEELRSNLAASGRLVGAINAELDLQATTVDRLRAEAEESQRLASLSQAEAEAVRTLVERAVESAQAEASRIGTKQQWLFFLAGLLAAVPVAVFANFLFAWLTS